MSSADQHTSREWDISQRIRVLLGHMAYGTITASEYAELQDLQRERVDRMIPSRVSASAK